MTGREEKRIIEELEVGERQRAGGEVGHHYEKNGKKKKKKRRMRKRTR